MSGDARLELWEALCTCGGARKSPDVRMCRCLAPHEAGLACEGCGRGVLLIKQGWNSTKPFWGCSNYKKGGCKFTRPFGPPHDRQAAEQLEGIHKRERQAREELECIVDEHELDWVENCHCGGAKHLNTFECYMRSEGGCGFLPLCPECGQGLFLKDGTYGQYWQCQGKRSGRCNYQKSYKPHSTPRSEAKEKKKKPRLGEPTTSPTRKSVIQDVSNDSGVTASSASPSIQSPDPKATVEAKSAVESSTPPVVSATKSTVLSPEQKATIEANRQEALRKRQHFLEKQATQSAEKKKSPDTVLPSPGAVCKIAQNDALFRAFVELADLYQKEGNYNARATYQKVAEAICKLDVEVTADNAKSMGKGKSKVAHIGKASADKMHEFVTTGKIKKLEEKKKALGTSD